MNLFGVRLLIALTAVWFATSASAADSTLGFGLWTEVPGEELNFDLGASGVGCEELPPLQLDIALWPEGPNVDVAMPQGCLESFTGEVSEDWPSR
jgi:hypothetical protein